MKNKRRFCMFDFLLLSFIISVIFCVFSVLSSDSVFLDTIITKAEIETKNTANLMINDAVNKTINDMNVSSSDFFESNDINGTLSISANTILINKFCADISNNITKNFSLYEENIVQIPLGVMLGIDVFSNFGPDIDFEIIPSKEAIVDYETSFTSSGINQTNFKIWLSIKTNVRILNPIQDKDISFERKIMLVDTIINGKVPTNFIGMNKGEYTYE